VCNCREKYDIEKVKQLANMYCKAEHCDVMIYSLGDGSFNFCELSFGLINNRVAIEIYRYGNETA
jgi:hypothetical protein